MNDPRRWRQPLLWCVLLAGCANGTEIELGHPDVEIEPPATSSTAATQDSRDSTQSPKPVSLDDTGLLGLPSEEVKQLTAGGPPGTLRWLYPYDGTVFPRDMLSPALMWEGDPATELVHVHIRSSAFEYKTILKPMIGSGRVLWTNPMKPQLRLPQTIWDTAGRQTLGKHDMFTIALTVRVNGVVAGPIISHFYIATASIKGSVYYTSYSSTLLSNSNNAGNYGSLLRIPPKRSTEVALAGSSEGPGFCGGCHSVAAKGAHLLSQSMSLNTSIEPQAWSYQIDLVTGAVGMPAAATTYAPIAALYPDGSKYLTGSLGGDPLLRGYGNPIVMPTYALALLANNKVPRDATLYDTAARQVIPDTGIPAGALMPMFSPDGTRLVFNDIAIERAHGLAMMDYDTIHDRASNYTELTRELPPGGAPLPADKPGWRPGWPAFLPDNKAVVFVRTDSLDFTSTSSSNFSPSSWAAEGDPNRQSLSDMAKKLLKSSDLHIVDIATNKVTVLAKAMGFDTPTDFASGNTYLPFGENDSHHNYYPTLSPVAAGGYFWVFFDSLRNYGNLGVVRQLWGAAIDIHPDGKYTTDLSHPPFYLEGQEFGTDNHRAFAALEVCKPNGQVCASGIDCCEGFCSIPTATSDAERRGTCSMPPSNSCADRDDACAATPDCCNPGDSCINGYCAFVPLL